MSKPAKPAAAKKDAAHAADGAAPKSKKKLIMIVVAAVVLLAGGGGAWFFMKAKDPQQADSKKVEVAKDPKFISLETFTVNLQREESDQYLQINVSLKVMEPELEDKIKAVLPEIRSKLNLLLSSKKPSELATVIGKKKLAIEIATETNSVLGIHNAPQKVESEHVAANAASGVAPSPAEGTASAAPEASAAPAANSEPVAADAPAESGGGERKGVVDVLFTSFIIQ
jgi:flagellar FliL protein